MARFHGFDAGSVARIGDAVRWVEEFTSEDGIDIGEGADDGATLEDIENQTDTSGGGNFAKLVSIGDWDAGTTQSFTDSYEVTTTTTDDEGNETTTTETVTESITASNPFGNAAAGTGVIINCGADGWVLIAATCKEDDEDEEST